MYYIPGWRRNTTPPSGFNSMESAPHDGTPVEICCAYGVAPWYGVFKWVNGDWIGVLDSSTGVSEGSYLSWRPLSGKPENYIDPTNGKQNTPEYWRKACGL